MHSATSSSDLPTLVVAVVAEGADLVALLVLELGVLAVGDLAGRQPARVLLRLLDLIRVVLRPRLEPLRLLHGPRELLRALQVGRARHLTGPVLARRRLLHVLERGVQRARLQQPRRGFGFGFGLAHSKLSPHQP